jgi:hypothetical protein
VFASTIVDVATSVGWRVQKKQSTISIIQELCFACHMTLKQGHLLPREGQSEKGQGQLGLIRWLKNKIILLDIFQRNLMAHL